jgi:sirohydrochlorin cobaltochelatase
MTLRHLPSAADLGLLLIGHGTRDFQGQREFRQVAELLAAEANGVAVEVCFLELAEPSIREGVARLIERGVRQVIVLPLLLFSAGHAQRDIPQAVQAAFEDLTRGELAHGQDPQPATAVWQAPVLACHPDIVELSARRYREAIAQAENQVQSKSPGTGTTAKTLLAKTLLLIVGRGSYEAETNAEFARFARLRWEREPVGWLETCFVAMTRPTLDEGLRMAASMPFERIVVQPHLLFPGELTQGIRAAVGAARERAPDRQWIVTEPLGADELLVRALLSQAELDGARFDGARFDRAGLEKTDESDSNKPQTTGKPPVAVHPEFVDCLAGRADLALPEPSV